MNDFTHLDKFGNVKMVDVTDKMSSTRMAKAEGKISMLPETILAIQDDALPKGNVLTTAKIAGIQTAKKTAEMIPMCHQLNLSFVDIEFELEPNAIGIRSTVKTKEATGVEMEALSAASGAALTIYDMCKSVDKTMTIGEIKLVTKMGGKSDHATDYRPRVGVVTLSDSISEGKCEDKSGPILANGFRNAGCSVDQHIVLPDGSEDLVSTIHEWIKNGVELIITTGGTGLGPRDLTIETLDKIFNSKLPGIEQALHAYGRGKVKSAMLSRLTAGVVDGAVVICLPGSTGAVKDAINVLIPTVFHSFHMIKGEKH
ncbi:MAG: bifunctional molybdenum cofactor biosynthesis protein MoaC/MoaB [Candidatus Marinimicrobia bacterium]|nr:bifunctional molybdenum cofactor biosynthesis protein MoaC/MoaB [Candidatus Neomarinimicrobiota bacterium]MBT3617282.1 bifunctional molybdenum cofactor biosynthesis protein MoaC/MoaB [Candidatus Neomarinimicrobiota bacterium]MBT3828845.1 bifunctional molybdenum cofactor biosynthesis protein MoaC/MoaB [Candidatus Neomarinimicrobiota bacterium]MBT3997816.1 bifunctional molybdenum cofactor biosynthesis protein MoaC/MoaB [Candidatus Neomarinimicrobiota bacterium]MBT4280530.1 bifunctional molybde